MVDEEDLHLACLTILVELLRGLIGLGFIYRHGICSDSLRISVESRVCSGGVLEQTHGFRTEVALGLAFLARLERVPIGFLGFPWHFGRAGVVGAQLRWHPLA